MRQTTGKVGIRRVLSPTYALPKMEAMMEITAERIENNIERFFNEMGKPFVTEPASEETLEKFRGKLPEGLLEFWRVHGFCSFRDGLITKLKSYHGSNPFSLDHFVSLLGK
jgi:hypothetical protein